jgi:hypothetical protein
MRRILYSVAMSLDEVGLAFRRPCLTRRAPPASWTGTWWRRFGR